ncbi:hypothetical protein ACHAP8_009536 [Fusarium lateritium]
MEDPAPIEPIHDTNVAPVESAPEPIQTESVENDSTDDGAASKILPIEVAHDANASDAIAAHDETMEDPVPIAVADHENVAASDVNDAEVDKTNGRPCTHCHRQQQRSQDCKTASLTALPPPSPPPATKPTASHEVVLDDPVPVATADNGDVNDATVVAAPTAAPPLGRLRRGGGGGGGTPTR